MMTQDECQRVNAAVQAAESVTSAEIIPVVASSSGRYDRAEDLVGLWTAAIAMIVCWSLFPLPSADSGDWSSANPVWQIVALLAAMVGGFLAGAWMATRCGPLRRLFTPTIQMQEEVASRAREVFFDQRVHHASRASGLFFYVSLYERTACVLADSHLLERAGADFTKDLCEELIAQLRQVTPAESLSRVITSAGTRLAACLPREPGTTNELPDALIVMASPR